MRSRDYRLENWVPRRALRRPTFLLHFSRIARNKAGFPQWRTKRLIIGHERARNPVANCTHLTGDSAALDVRFDIEFAIELHRTKGLLLDHAACFAAKELIQGAAVDRHLASALTQVNPCAGSFAAH